MYINGNVPQATYCSSGFRLPRSYIPTVYSMSVGLVYTLPGTQLLDRRTIRIGNSVVSSGKNMHESKQQVQFEVLKKLASVYVILWNSISIKFYCS